MSIHGSKKTLMINTANRSLLIYMFLFSFFRALDVLIGKWIYTQGIDPISWLLPVYFLASVFRTWYVYWTQQQPSLQDLQQHKNIFRAIALTAAVGTIMSYRGLSMTSAINYSLLAQSTVLFVALGAHMLFADERLSIPKIALLIVFVVGAYLVTTS